MPILRVHNMSHDFGGLRAVQDYGLEIEMGQIRGLIGPNGAGKTTIFNLLTGIYTPTEGEILLDGRRINGLPAHRIASMGISRTFQNLLLWRHMTVLEHVKMAHYSRIRYGLVGAFVDGYPNPSGGFHVGGTLALGGARLSADDNSAIDDFDGGGLGLGAWVGYDAWIASEWSMGGQLQFVGVLTRQDQEGVAQQARAGGISLVFTSLFH